MKKPYRIETDSERRYSDPATQTEIEEWEAAVERGDPEYAEATAEAFRKLRDATDPEEPAADDPASLQCRPHPES